MKWKLLILIPTLILSNPAAAWAETYDLCAMSKMREHRPANAVNHEPRADVTHGKSPVTVPDPMYIPLTIDLAERMNINLPQGIEMQGMIGLLSVYKDGRIMYDGKEITTNIQDICNDGTNGTATDEQTTQNGNHTDTR